MAVCRFQLNNYSVISAYFTHERRPKTLSPTVFRMRALLLHALLLKSGRNTVWATTRRIKTAMESFARFAWSCVVCQIKPWSGPEKVTTLPRADDVRTH